MLLLCILIVACCSPLLAQTSDWAWAVRAGDTAFDSGYDIALDAQGNQYVTGYFTGTTVFGTTSLTSSGGWDIFVAKLDTSGNWLWAVKAGGPEDDTGYGIALDNSGNVLVTGKFRGTATIGTAVFIGYGDDDIFVSKLNNSGNWTWSRRAGGTASDEAADISTDANGYVFLTGHFAATASFGSTDLTTEGGSDIFIAKMNPSGTWQWARQAGGTGNDRGKGIALDASSNAFITGDIYEDASFGTIILAGRVYDMFVARIDSSGSWDWAKKGGSTGIDWGFGIALDPSGNAYATGFFEGTAGFGTSAVISAGSEDIFVAKISSAGIWQWARQAGGTGVDEGLAIAVDGSGRISVTGFFSDTAVFGGGSLTSVGEEDIFVARISENGFWQWCMRAGGLARDWGLGIALDPLSYINLTGQFRRTADFGSHTLAGAGVNYAPDIFVARITARPLRPLNLTISCSGFWDLLLDWDDVTQDTFYNTISGVHYLVYVINDDPYSPYAVLLGENGSITSSQLLIDGGAGFEREFFQVSAVLGD
jgi:hypothetical protein